MGKVNKYLQKIFIAPLLGYQLFISPIIRPRCRFFPSCSEYSKIAIQQHGIVHGIGLTILRLIRCNPFSKGGVDPVPNRESDKV